MTVMATALAHGPAQRADLRRLGPLVAGVLVAHALLLALPRQPGGPSGPPAAARSTLQFRLLEAAPKAAAVVAPPAAVTPAAPRLPSQGGVREPAPPQVAEAPDVPALAPAPLLPPADTWLGMALKGVPTDDDRYFARSQLAVAPAAVDAVAIDYPSFPGDAGRYAAELTLFIDEHGEVVRVRVDDGALPPPLEEAARRAFMQARFRPGEAADQGPVKSRIRIEVRFDSAAPR